MNEKKSLQKNILSPRDNHEKFSLKMRRKVTQHTQKSTACHSIYGGSGKTSIKNLLLHTRTRNHQSQNFLSLKYQDIRVKVIHKPKHFLSSVLCSISKKKQDEGCKCEPKCLWIDRWLSLSSSYPKINLLGNTTVQNSVQQQIKKDLKRTQPDIKIFEHESYQNALFSTLINYSKIDKEIGYVQGMNMIASVLVFHAKNVYQCTQLMRYLMIICNFRQIYLQEFKLAHKCADLLVRSLNFRCHDLYKHIIQDKQINLNIFIIGWLLAMLGNLVPLEHMHLVINHFIEKGWYGLLNILLTLLIYLKSELLELSDQVELMEKLSINSFKKMVINWQEIIVTSNNINVIKEDFK